MVVIARTVSPKKKEDEREEAVKQRLGEGGTVF